MGDDYDASQAGRLSLVYLEEALAAVATPYAEHVLLNGGKAHYGDDGWGIAEAKALLALGFLYVGRMCRR